jgi:hypothetical protein
VGNWLLFLYCLLPHKLFFFQFFELRNDKYILLFLNIVRHFTSLQLFLAFCTRSNVCIHMQWNQDVLPHNILVVHTRSDPGHLWVCCIHKNTCSHDHSFLDRMFYHNNYSLDILAACILSNDMCRTFLSCWFIFVGCVIY